MKQKQIKRVCAALCAFCILGGTGIGSFAHAAGSVLTQEELADVVRPTVVRIVQHITGTVSTPVFDVDPDTLTFSVLSDQLPTVTPVDEYITGSGFVVNPNGYIITNSHVISQKELKSALDSQVLENLVDQKAAELSDDGAQNFEQNFLAKFGDENSELTADQAKFRQGKLAYIDQKLQYNLKSDLIVVNPNDPATDLSSLMAKGFPAEIKSINENFDIDDDDIGLIHINQTNLPTVNLGTSATLATGQKIYVFGFPASAQFDSADLIQPSFTQGVISAVKNDGAAGFPIFQTDAKISSGSSGGPLLDESGNVNGIVTYATSATGNQTGDGFAFAIPIDLASKVLAAQSISGSDAYAANFENGLSLMDQSECKGANADFQKVAAANNVFDATSSVQKYISQCNALIASGKSLDNPYEVFISKIKNLGVAGWGLIIFLVIAISGFVYVIRRQQLQINQEEVEINALEQAIASPSYVPPMPAGRQRGFVSKKSAGDAGGLKPS